jgi:hypothetical protein
VGVLDIALFAFIIFHKMWYEMRLCRDLYGQQLSLLGC